MKILRLLVKITLGILVCLLVTAIFLPKNFEIVSTKTVNHSPSATFKYLSILKNQEIYSKWITDESNISLKYEGKDGEIGAKQYWSGDNSEGIQIITHKSHNSLKYLLEFKRPFHDSQMAETIVDSISTNQCRVTFKFYNKSSYPFNLLSFIGKKMITETQESNLQQVKKLLE